MLKNSSSRRRKYSRFGRLSGTTEVEGGGKVEAEVGDGVKDETDVGVGMM
jgi:hypothetical protein